MKRAILFMIAGAMLLSLAGCSDTPDGTGGADAGKTDTDTPPYGVPTDVVIPDGTHIDLSDGAVTVDGAAVTKDSTAAVYTARDIVYYESGHDFTYGEGTGDDEHTAEEAAAHTVVHITAPGTYVLSGKLSAGQIAVDLGEDAEDDPEAVVNLVLNNVDITCTVAPAIIFYNVYECGDKDNTAYAVDTSAAGANVYIANGSENTVSGSYVARIYKSFELSEDGTEVVDSKKLHKYDGALYSKMSMNVTGNLGHLTINAENEGLDSELHLTVNGGVIDIISGNDGINTNEDGASVTTVNAGALTITVNGSTGEGDGIDSNGWLVINGGAVNAYACSTSGDAGIDSDMGIIINGGQVIATGNMLDAIDSASMQKYVIFNTRGDAGTYTLKDAEGNEIMPVHGANSFSILIVSSPAISDGLYALYNGSTLVASAEPGEGNMGGFGHGGMGGLGGQRPDGERPDGKPPKGFDPDDPPEGFDPDDVPEGFDPDDAPGGTLGPGDFAQSGPGDEIPPDPNQGESV